MTQIQLVSVCCDTAQALVFLLMSVCCDTAQALVFLLVSLCCDTVHALVCFADVSVLRSEGRVLGCLEQGQPSGTLEPQQTVDLYLGLFAGVNV